MQPRAIALPARSSPAVPSSWRLRAWPLRPLPLTAPKRARVARRHREIAGSYGPAGVRAEAQACERARDGLSRLCARTRSACARFKTVGTGARSEIEVRVVTSAASCGRSASARDMSCERAPAEAQRGGDFWRVLVPSAPKAAAGRRAGELEGRRRTDRQYDGPFAAQIEGADPLSWGVARPRASVEALFLEVIRGNHRCNPK